MKAPYGSNMKGESKMFRFILVVFLISASAFSASAQTDECTYVGQQFCKVNPYAPGRPMELFRCDEKSGTLYSTYQGPCVVDPRKTTTPLPPHKLETPTISPITGTWEGRLACPDDTYTIRLVLQATSSTSLSGTVYGKTKTPFNGSIQGSTITGLVVSPNPQNGTVRWQLTVNSSASPPTLDGTALHTSPTDSYTCKYQATKVN
jgi:hypothetical protein